MAAYTYLGRPCLGGDPASAMVEGAELGPREEDWWYHGHPCYRYVTGTHGGGLQCEGIELFDGLCGPCRMALRATLDNMDFGGLEDIRELADEVFDVRWAGLKAAGLVTTTKKTE